MRICEMRAVGVFLLFSAQSRAAEPASNLADLSLEQLSNIVVTSVSRREESLANAPASIGAILAAVLFASLVIALLVSTVLQAAITNPIVAVTDVARRVIERRDFSLRVTRTTDDEIGYLVDAFNAMLQEVGRRAEALEISNRSLEGQIVERRSAEDALRAADRRKDEFLATLAHELRNPLAPLRNGLEIVDDNRDFASSLETLLRGLGNDVRVANDGAEGLEAAQSFKPDGAFLDIGMPKLNGYDLAARLRSIPTVARCYLVAITGWGQESDRRRAREAGFDRHLMKPADKEAIVAILRGLH